MAPAKVTRGLRFGAASLLVTVLIGGTVWASGQKLDEGAELTGAPALIASPDSDDWQVREDRDTVYATTGEVTPDPAVALHDRPKYYEDDCQTPPGDSTFDPTCVYGEADGEKTIAMLGDSKMGQWLPAVDSIARSEGWRLEMYTKSACPFAYVGKKSDCKEFGKNVNAHFESEDAPDVALVSQGSATAPELRYGLTEAIRGLQAQGTEVIILADSPRPPVGEPVYTCIEEHPEDYSACAFPADVNDGRRGVGTGALRAAANVTGAPFVDLNEWICPPGTECPPVIGGTLVYRHGSHVTASYIRTLTPMLYRELAARNLTSRDSAEITVDDTPEPGDA